MKNNAEIARLKKELRDNDIAVQALSREIEYLQLQENFCLDRYEYYKSIDDQVKVLQWDVLSDYCKDLYLEKRNKREALKKEWYPINSRVIELLCENVREITGR